MRGIARTVVLLALGCAAACPAASASDPLGTLTQLSGPAGCFSFDGSGGCVKGRGIDQAESLAITHDGRFAYGTSFGILGSEDALTAYERLPGGRLVQLAGRSGCFTEDCGHDGTAGVCTAARTIGTGDGTSIAISPDDRFLYAVSLGDNGPSGVAVFRRDLKTGALTQLSGAAGCVNPADDALPGCAAGRILTWSSGIAISPDPQGRFVYVTSYGGSHHGLAVFARDPSTGALGQLSGPSGCLSSDGLSEASGQTCTKIRGIDSNSSVEDPVLSPDGRSLYVSAYHTGGISTTSGTIAFSRNPNSGMLTQLPGAQGCFTSTGTGPDGSACTRVRALRGAYKEAISPDGANLYVGAYDADALVVFRRQAGGTLVQLPGNEGCISADGASQDGPHTCTIGRAVSLLQTPAVSPDGRTVYTAGFPTQGALGVFSRDLSSGALTQLPGLPGCFSDDGASEAGLNTCTASRALGSTYDVVVSPDGGNVYTAGETVTGGGLAAFARQTTPVCTSRLLAVMQATPTPIALPCRDPNGRAFTRAVLVGPLHGTLGRLSATGTVLYTPKTSYAGLDRIVFRATDATGAGAAAVIAIDVVRDNSRPRCRDIGVAGGRVARFLRHGLPVHMRCSEAVRLKVTLSLRHRRKIASGSASLGAAGRAKLRLAFTRAARRALGRSDPRRLAVTIAVVAIDRVGNRSSRRLHLILR